MLLDFLKLVNEIHDILCAHPELTLPVGDPLHLWKGLRRHFQLFPIAVLNDLPLASDIEEVKKNY